MEAQLERVNEGLTRKQRSQRAAQPGHNSTLIEGTWPESKGGRERELLDAGT